MNLEIKIPNFRLLGFSLVLAALGSTALAQGGGEFVPLLDGDILVGEITTHDETSIEVKRTDNGGLVRLRWGQLAPPFERALRSKLGYDRELGEELQVEADEITLNDGSKRVGRIVEQTPDRIVLKDPRSTLEYQRSMIAGAPARVRVAALDVFTKDELFNEKLGSVDVTTAQGNFDLALFLSQTQDFARAIQYLNDAKKIDPNFHPGEIQKMLTRLEAQKLRQDEFDYLRDIEFERNQYHYDKAIALCDGFVGKFPKAAPETKADVEKRKKNVLEMKQKAMMRANFDAFYHAADMLARSKASDRKVGLEAAKAYANGEMKTEVAEATTKAVQRSFPEMTTTESQKLWKGRGKLPKVHNVCYGSGTFVLGKDGARKGISIPGKATAAAPSSDEQAMVKKLAKMLERQGGTAAGGQGKLDPKDDWWLRASSFERHQFVLAWFVENSGEFEIVGYLGRPCVGCGGTGVVPVANMGPSSAGGISAGGRNAAPQQQAPSGTQNAPCPTCHETGIERILLYR